MSAARNTSARTSTRDRYLEGQLLLAMPTMADKRFRRAVIFMCRHNDEGAMGIIVNQPASKLSFPGLLSQLNLIDGNSDGGVPDELLDKSVHVGGPVSSERGFVLHSDDLVMKDSTMVVGGGICLTATLDILKCIAVGKGPAQSLLALGYAGWAPGQLETEIQANGWLHCAANPELVFASDHEQTYQRALSSLGVDLTFLVGAAGHA